ncbi:MAG: hypothetical protein HRF45_10555 [Fimbriimonadia bacterium]
MPGQVPPIHCRKAEPEHLGNICLRLGGRRLEWDPVKEDFRADAEASQMVARTMRGAWSV